MDDFHDSAAEKRGAMEALREVIELTMEKSPSAAAQVVSILRESDLGLKVLNAGFGGKVDETARVSFSEFCVDAGRVDVLRAVIKDSGLGASPAALYKASCSADHQVGGDIWSGWRQSLHQHAVKASNPEALRLALELDPDERCLTEFWPVMGGTLHFNALVRLANEASDVQGAAECCRILLAIKAPLHEERPEAAHASGIFFDGGDWGDSGTARELLAEYMAARLVDLDDAPEGLKQDFIGMLPLRASIAQGNAAGAVACIDFGCDIAKALKSTGLQQATGAKDLIELVRATALETAEQEARMVACVTEALMRRQLRSFDSERAAMSPGANPVESRRRRAMGV